MYGLDGEIPPGLPALKLPGTDIEVRRWPTVYVTPRVRLYLTLWAQAQAGRSPRSDGVVTWPARLVEVLSVIDRWPPIGSRDVRKA